MTCSCTHGIGFHDLRKDGTRSGCSVYGCSCALFTATTTPVEQLAADLGLTPTGAHQLLRRMTADPDLEARLHDALTTLDQP